MEKNNLALSRLLSLIKYPLITEKSTNLYCNEKYTFIVDKILTKPQIKFAIENIFKTKVISIHTLNLPTKTRRVKGLIGKCTSYKKAIIKLREGYKITELFN